MRQCILLLLVCALAAVGCSKKPAEPKPSASPAATDKVILSTTVARNSAFDMTITFDPSPPKMSSKTGFKVHLTDLAGHPVADASVRASLVMPLMDMGKNEFPLAPAGKGTYEGVGQFTMSGEWEVVLNASAGNKTGKTTFNVRVED